jgi:hypothetical protein
VEESIRVYDLGDESCPLHNDLLKQCVAAGKPSFQRKKKKDSEDEL